MKRIQEQQAPKTVEELINTIRTVCPEINKKESVPGTTRVQALVSSLQTFCEADGKERDISMSGLEKGMGQSQDINESQRSRRLTERELTRLIWKSTH